MWTEIMNILATALEMAWAVQDPAWVAMVQDPAWAAMVQDLEWVTTVLWDHRFL